MSRPTDNLFSEYEEKHAGLKENKDHLQTHFRVLRTEMSKQRNKEREMLTKLTLASEEALKRQKSIDEKVFFSQFYFCLKIVLGF